MKNIYLIFLFNLLFISCIDLISEEEYYESVHLKQAGWLEFYENSENQNIQLEQDFTFQVWFSGQKLSELDAPCILTINDQECNFSIYRNPNVNNLLMIYLNQELLSEVEVENIDLDNENNFYLLSAIINNQTLSIYFNESKIFQDTIPNINDPSIIVGANKIDNSVTNLWYGYIDEIRLWNEALEDSIINFHNQYKYKISSSYTDEYLDALIGLWDFKVNTMGDSPSNTFQDINDNNTYTIIYNSGLSSSELSKNGR